ncbi:hypothetical protein BJP37_11960 [Moorena bouillonii PNG]|uniref:Uncharacterized protein n=1 Tax=Moorena bouillonii PNG TaxID=568701 RepID=A0A1U7N109_9CYAN|nr:hypothetical protein BJP37_11960 [Moorena bouillonii PNG]
MVDPPQPPLTKGGVGKVPLIKGKADFLKNLLPLAVLMQSLMGETPKTALHRFCLLPFALKSSSTK